MKSRPVTKRKNRSGFVTEKLEERQLLSGLVVTYNTNGISTLAYGGQTLINIPADGSYEGFRVENYWTLNSDGVTYTMQDGGSPTSTNWNSANLTLTYNYSFGSIAVQYVQPNGVDRLNMIFTVTNKANSGVTLGGVDIDPASIHFPNPIPASAPGAWYPLYLDSTAGPNVIPANYTSGSMAYVNDSNPTAPIYTSLFTLDNTTGENYYLFVGTAPKNNIPANVPLQYVNTAPGQTDTFEESLRFGPAGTDPLTLATDVEQAYAAAYPLQLNWPDRRSIASLHLTSTTTTATNPEGWSFYSNVDVTTQTGLNTFAQQLLAYATSSISIMKTENAQGMIVWDVEGQKWAQPTTYIGDASLAFNTTIENAVNVTYSTGSAVTTPMGYDYTGAGALYNPVTGAPEPIITQFFQEFSNAGYRTGVTIRPTQITFSNGVPSQTTANEVTELENKISYANSMWGTTIFYLDSNSGYDAAALQTVQAAFPNVLIIPEHSTTSVYAYSAPYGQLLTYDFTGTPELARLTYPNAFSVIYPADGDGGNSSFPDYFNAIEASVAAGDSILFRGWFADPYNTTINNVYKTADNKPGIVTGLTESPGNNAVTLNWNIVTGAGMFESGTYNVSRSLSSNGTFTVVGSGVLGNAFTDTTVTNGTTYYYKVQAVDGVGSGTASAAISATPNSGPVFTNQPSATATTDASVWSLSTLATDSTGNSSLIYTWTVASSPNGAPSPTFSANASNAAANSSATFYQAGTYILTLTVKDPAQLSNSANVTVNVGLAVANSAAASPNPVPAKTANLTALASDSAGASALTYTWTCVSTPANAPPPILSVNGTSAANNTVATFHQAGTYSFTVTVTDQQGLATTSTTNVVVSQTVTTLVVQPPKATVANGAQQLFYVIATDQFRNPIASPTVAWSVSGGGTIGASTGLFTASQTGTYTVTAVSGLTAVTTVTVIPTANESSVLNSTTGLLPTPVVTTPVATIPVVTNPFVPAPVTPAPVSPTPVASTGNDPISQVLDGKYRNQRRKHGK